LLALTGLAKQSVMLALWAAVLYGFIRLRLYRRWGNLLAIFATLILTGVAIAITYPRGFQSAEVSGFSIWSLTFGQHPFIWFMLYYLWAYLYILARLAILGIKTFDDLLHAFSGKQLLDVELLIVLLAASIVPAFVFDLDFNGYYFTDVPVVIGMALLLGMLTKFQEEFRLPGLSQSLFKRDAILANWAVAILLVWMTGAIVVRLGKDSLNTVRDMLQTQARFSNLPADGSGISRSEVVMGWVRSADFGAVSRWAASHESYLSSQSGYAVMTTLEELHYLPVSVRRESILFIPQTNRAYWDFFPEDSNTLWRFQSLLAPAFSGLAQLEGIPPGETWNEFGFQAYDLPFDDQALTTDDQAGLCEAALARGFSRVIVFDVNEKGDPAITHIPCP
jgi:hypothetical protein